jgi:hypothetical protein
MYDYSPDASLDEVLRIAYLAKERGRMAGGVGPETDGWIIDKEGVNVISKDRFEKAREYWKDKNVIR